MPPRKHRSESVQGTLPQGADPSRSGRGRRTAPVRSALQETVQTNATHAAVAPVQPDPHDSGRQTPRPHKTWFSGSVGNLGATAKPCCNAGQARRSVVATTIGGAVPESQTDLGGPVESRTVPAPSWAWTYRKMSPAPGQVPRPIGLFVRRNAPRWIRMLEEHGFLEEFQAQSAH